MLLTPILATLIACQQPAGLIDNIDRDPLPDPAAELARWTARFDPAPAIRNGLAARPMSLPTCLPESPSVGSDRASLEFTAAVEEWVSARPPPAVAALVDRLGDRRWRERDAASKGLESRCRANPGDARWLFVARRHQDPEIAIRVNNILRRLNPCRDCEGKGGHKGQWSEYACPKCEGFGTEWVRGAWD